MSLRELYEALCASLGQIAPVSAQLDLEPETPREYIVVSISDGPGEGGDDQSGCRVAGVTVYYVCPLLTDPIDKRAAVRSVCEGVADTLVRETDQGGYVQCWVFSFSRVLG